MNRTFPRRCVACALRQNEVECSATGPVSAKAALTNRERHSDAHANEGVGPLNLERGKQRCEMTDIFRMSDRLKAFIEEAPEARAPHLAFMLEAAAEIEMGKVILDVGSGTSPFQELFPNRRYIRLDWNHSIYDAPVDVRGSAAMLPIANSCLDAVVCTEVLEHVSEPQSAAREMYRVLKPGAKLWLTTPFVWPLHEEPYDYYRYTSHGLRHILEQAGFYIKSILPLSDSFSTVAALMLNAEWLMGKAEDGLDVDRGLVGRVLKATASMVQEVSRYDTRWILPLGYRAIAVREL